MTNLLNVIQAAGGDKSTILKTTVFIKDMNDFAKINAVYEKVRAPILRRGPCAFAHALCSYVPTLQRTWPPTSPPAPLSRSLVFPRTSSSRLSALPPSRLRNLRCNDQDTIEEDVFCLDDHRRYARSLACVRRLINRESRKEDSARSSASSLSLLIHHCHLAIPLLLHSACLRVLTKLPASS